MISILSPPPSPKQNEEDKVALKFSPEKEVLFTESDDPSISSHQQTIVFKVMLTDPRRYTVRPNYALLAPGQSTSVKVTLRALPNAEEALQQLLTSRQALLFKWRAVNAAVWTSESSEASPFQEENPAALFIESTSPVLEQKMKVAFKRVEVTDDAPGGLLSGAAVDFGHQSQPVESRATTTTTTTDLLDITPSEATFSPSPVAPAAAVHTPSSAPLTPVAENSDGSAEVPSTKWLQHLLTASCNRLEVVIIVSALLALLLATSVAFAGGVFARQE
ncbi:hypothetical protein TYRP_020651 [Tyrophagus putrescentiae]|nr:hypothetical protein TYRP_020651 [Tyrophagus putrescentiae]